MKDTRVLNGLELNAYIIPSTDAHNSEYLADKDKRRQFISGFSGSSGTALVTHQNALLWTDGRYFFQASQELDSNWLLMKDGLPETPSIADWLIKNLPSSSRVGIDATLYEEDLYLSLASKLTSNKIELVNTKNNLVDLVWEENDRPVFDPKPLILLDVKHTGKSMHDKLRLVREEMEKLNVGAYVVTSLDEIAWLVNMRGRDIPFGAVFYSYCIITSNSCKLFTNSERLNQSNENSETFKTYLLSQDPNFELYNYEQFYTYFENFVNLKPKKKSI